MKISPLDAKKKKVIQNIRTLLNDHPELHPLSHNVLLSATYTVLKRLHKDMIEIDGYHHKYSPEEKVAGYAKAIQNAKGFTSKRPLSQNTNDLEDIEQKEELTVAKNKKKEEELEERKENERLDREKKRREGMERQRDLEKDIIEMMGFDRDII